MDSFSLLKYLRGGVAAGAQRAPAASTTIAASACENGDGDGDDDAASFFDLEFAVPGDESAASDAEEERVEFNFALAPGAGDAVAVAAEAEAESEADAEAPPPAPLLRPATRFRVLLLKLRKPKAPPADGAGAAQAPPRQPAVASRFLVKFRVEDAPLASLFTRDNSSRTSDAGADRRAPAAAAAEAQQQQEEEDEASASASVTAEERRFAKEVVLRYLSSKIKPLYVKVSRRYGERLRLGGAASEGEETDAEPDPSPAPPSQGPSSSAPAPQPVVVACGVRAPRAGVPAGLRQVCKRLGKSRSASSAVAAAPSPAAAAALTGPQAQRRDDSLLQVQDGIQSAIAHCKRSFNASKEPRSMTATTGGEARLAGAGEGA